MGSLKIFPEIAPANDKEVCANCTHWILWGVRTGICEVTEDEDRNTDQDYTCPKFELNNNIRKP